LRDAAGLQARPPEVSAPGSAHKIASEQHTLAAAGTTPQNAARRLCRLEAATADGAQLRSLMEDFGCIAAWAHLRGAGRQGSAIADELIAFGHARKRWRPALLRTFRAACDGGAFEKLPWTPDAGPTLKPSPAAP